MMKFNEELLSAYLDDELTADEKSAVERELLRSAKLRQLLEELKSVRSLVSELPAPPKLDDATAAIMARAEQMMVGLVDPRTTNLGSSPANNRSQTRGRLAAFLAIAATLLLAFIGSWQAFAPQVATRNRLLTEDNQTVPTTQAPESTASETTGSTGAAPMVAAPAPSGRAMKQSLGSTIADSAAENMAPESMAANASEAPMVMMGSAPAPMMDPSAQPAQMAKEMAAKEMAAEEMVGGGLAGGGMAGGMMFGMSPGGFTSPGSIPGSGAASSAMLLVDRELPQNDLETRFGTTGITTAEMAVPAETMTRFLEQQARNELNLETVENLPAEASRYYFQRVELSLPLSSAPTTSGAMTYDLAMGSGGMGGAVPNAGESLAPSAASAGLAEIDGGGDVEREDRDSARGAGRIVEERSEGGSALSKDSRGLGDRPKKSVTEAAPAAADANLPQEASKPGSGSLPDIRVLIPRSRWEGLRRQMNLPQFVNISRFSEENLAARPTKDGASGDSNPDDPLMLVVIRVEPENRVQLPEEGLPPSPNPSR